MQRTAGAEDMAGAPLWHAPKVRCSSRGEECLERGTTIVELMVAIAILAVILASPMPVFAAMRNAKP
jgi:prepilin-type N-terminal cleavage/methylation domain-containing protein